jgi:hypothetical protein
MGVPDPDRRHRPIATNNRRRRQEVRGFGFAILGGPHKGRNENPTCYARTTQAAKHIRWVKARISERTGKLLPRRLTHWARYQDWIEHVRNSLTDEQREILFEDIWPMLQMKNEKVIVDIIVQFRGRQHADADHVASAVADALFPKPPPKKMRGPNIRPAYNPAWTFEQLKRSPGDGLVLARVLDFCDCAESAYVAVNIHGPYPRDAFLEGNPVKSFPEVVIGLPVTE